MIIATFGKIIVTAQAQENLPDWMTAGKDYVDGVLPCDVIAYRELPAPFQPEEK